MAPKCLPRTNFWFVLLFRRVHREQLVVPRHQKQPSLGRLVPTEADRILAAEEEVRRTASGQESRRRYEEIAPGTRRGQEQSSLASGEETTGAGEEEQQRKAAAAAAGQRGEKIARRGQTQEAGRVELAKGENGQGKTR